MSAAIECFKTRPPTALLTVEDMSSNYEMDDTDEREEKSKEFDESVCWVQADNEADIFIAASIEKEIE